MVKKAILGILFIGFAGILIYGAILRTNATTLSGQSEEAGAVAGAGRGRASTLEAPESADSRGSGRGRDVTANVTGEPAPGLGQQAAYAESNRVTEWQTVEGTVISVGPEALLIDLIDGRQVLVEGQPWLYGQSQGFTPRAGDQLVLTIFEEDEELKPGQINNRTTGQTVTLRLENGSPLWSGGMQGGQVRGNGGGNATGEQAGAGGIPVDWLTVEGVVVSADSAQLVIAANATAPVVVEGRAWAYALAQGFSIRARDTAVIMGLLEDGEFKAGSLENLVSGQRVLVRDTNGHPLWSGGGRNAA